MVFDLQKEYINEIESFLDEQLSEIEPIGGGDSSNCYKLVSSTGAFYFFKCSSVVDSDQMYRAEKDALLFIEENTSMCSPSVLSLILTEIGNGILMNWVERKLPSLTDREIFGVELAKMHEKSSDNFGWKEDNFISILSQNNSQSENWTDFYITYRILPLLKIGIDKGIYNPNSTKLISNLENRLNAEIPQEKPSLIHGDLWGGNYIINTDSKPVLIDPAIYFGHREMDIAMSLLFGQFGRPFYLAYQEKYPLEKGFESRMDLHQLYPLMVHAILFEGHYIEQVKKILEK